MTIKFIDHEIKDITESQLLGDRSKHLFVDQFNYVDYKTVLKKNINYLPLHLRQPFGCEDALDQIPNDIFLLMQQGIVRPLIIMLTEQWDLFDTYKWHENRLGLKPDFADVPYSKMVLNFTKRSIPEENITWVVPMDNHLKQIQYLRERGYSIKARFLQYDYFLELLRPKAIKNKITERQFKKHFACLCGGTPRNHRFGLIYKLWLENLIDKGAISCGAYKELKESKESNWMNDEFAHTSNFMNQFDTWPEKQNTFKSILPLEYDNLYNQHWDDIDESNIFQDNFIWIANERQIHNGVYVTEKTWKAIAYGSPLLINGQTGSLDYLRKQGYKTFNDFWDESYDNLGDYDRINAIGEIVKNISSKGLNEINSLYKEMMPILKHNQQTLINNMQNNNLIKELSNV